VKAELRKKLKKLAAESGLDLEEVVGGKRPSRTTGTCRTEIPASSGCFAGLDRTWQTASLVGRRIEEGEEA
jgi:hypothetical protein